MRNILPLAITGLALAVFVSEVSRQRPVREPLPANCIPFETATFDGRLAKTLLACIDTQPGLRRLNAATFPDGTRRHLYSR